MKRKKITSVVALILVLLMVVSLIVSVLPVSAYAINQEEIDNIQQQKDYLSNRVQECQNRIDLLKNEQANVLEQHRPKDPYVQAITIDTFRQIPVTIDHYFTKTAEEWMKVKLSRGYHSLEKRSAEIISHQEERFFAINERTPEKEAILRGEKWEPKPESKPRTRKRTNNKKK